MLGEVGDDLLGIEVVEHRADRHAQDDIVATGAILVGAAAVFTALADEFAGVAVVDQGIDVAVGDGIDAAAAAAIAAIGAAHGNVLLAAERRRAVAAIAGFYVYLGFVDKLHGVSFRLIRERWISLLCRLAARREDKPQTVLIHTARRSRLRFDANLQSNKKALSGG